MQFIILVMVVLVVLLLLGCDVTSLGFGLASGIFATAISLTILTVYGVFLFCGK
jgi:hypothetical protein